MTVPEKLCVGDRVWIEWPSRRRVARTIKAINGLIVTLNRKVPAHSEAPTRITLRYFSK